MKQIFWQDWGTFYGTTMVCCGWKNYDEVKKYLKRKKYYEWLKAMELKGDEFDSCHFSTWTIENVKTKLQVKYSILWLIDWKNDLRHYEILSHELVHAIQHYMEDFLDPKKEHEAVAYQHSYLFKNIANKLK